jgi:thioredoxin reductase (NADPH)
MRDALAARIGALRLAVDELDVDADAALEAEWGDKVPVLLAGDREICRYRLDAVALERFAAGEPAA